jgi:hypothetical protein
VLAVRRLLLSAGLLLAGALCVPVAGAASSPDGDLRAGAAQVDITPRLGGTTLGYVRPDMPVDGVHTRLTGRALVLQDGDTKLALLATDLAFPLDKDAVVARVADLGYTHETLVYTGTHTHSGPGGARRLAGRAARAGDPSADKARTPAKAAWGSSVVRGVARNRSVEAHLANHGPGPDLRPGHRGRRPGGRGAHGRRRAARAARSTTPTAADVGAGSSSPCT